MTTRTWKKIKDLRVIIALTNILYCIQHESPRPYSSCQLKMNVPTTLLCLLPLAFLASARYHVPPKTIEDQYKLTEKTSAPSALLNPASMATGLVLYLVVSSLFIPKMDVNATDTDSSSLPYLWSLPDYFKIEGQTSSGRKLRRKMLKRRRVPEARSLQN